MSHDFWVIPGDEIMQDWADTLGPEPRLPVVSPIPELAILPGSEAPEEIYRLALDVLPPEILARIVDKLAKRFGLSASEAKLALADGIPIRAEKTAGVIVENPQKWF